MIYQTSQQFFRWLALKLRAISRQGARHLLRFLFGTRARQQPGSGASGFVLPTAALLTIVIVLFAGAILLQTFSRTAEVAGSVEETRIDNAAQPAVDRAKAKLEFLFRDPRFPNGIPAERRLLAMLNNTDGDNDGLVDIDIGGGAQIAFAPDPITGGDTYTLPGETRINIDNDPALDNAWIFTSDLDGDNNPETVAYSITLLNTDPTGAITTIDQDDVGVKAANSLTRTGPIDVRGFGDSTSLASCPLPDLAPAQGWTPIGTGRFRKNFQVDVFVENGNPNTRSVSAFEFQQDREITQGNAFGVWFRYDLLIHPGPPFNLNGAIHTDGNLLTYNGDTRFFLVSAPNSCIYTNEANVITLAETFGTDPDDGLLRPIFQGQLIALEPAEDETLDLFPPSGDAPSNGPPDTLELVLNAATDSVAGQFTEDFLTANVAGFLLDPIALFTQNDLRSRNQQNGQNVIPLSGGPAVPSYNPNVRDPAFGNSLNPEIGDRVFNDAELRPFVDDTFRADDRWGPQPTYGRNGAIEIPAGENGLPIADNPPDTGMVEELLQNASPPNRPEEIGLDGYWERRSREQGARLIVGQRLELGNAFGWLFDAEGDGLPSTATGDDPAIVTAAPTRDRTYGDDPLNPPDPAFILPTGDGDIRPNQYRQQRSLRDNLAAAQAGVLYHLGNDPDVPAACLALTAHPGTATTKQNSTTFATTTFGGNTSVNVDFFSGTGTNGWEFGPPGGATTLAAFGNLIDNSPSSPLRIALDNLAHFAGDPDGAFPPMQETGAGAIQHPYPQLTMWGDFSNLRRSLDSVDMMGVDFENLSIADRSTIQTASCLLGMLAYNIDEQEQSYDEVLNNNGTSSSISTDLQNFSNGLRQLLNDECSNGLFFDPALYGDPACADSVFLLADTTGADAWVDLNPNSPCTDGSTDGAGFDPFCDEAEVIQTLFSPQIPGAPGTQALQGQGTQKVLDVLAAAGPPLPASLDTVPEIEAIADLITTVTQIRRDRTRGFATDGVPVDATVVPLPQIAWDANRGITNSAQFSNLSGLSQDVDLFSSCDPDIFEPVQTAGGGGNVGIQRSRLGLALLFCRGSVRPSYPSLYYLFPIASHDHSGTLTATATASGGIEALQPAQEPYVADNNIFNGVDGFNEGFTYQVIDDANSDGLADTNGLSDPTLKLQALVPTANCGSGGWCLPFRTAAVSPDPNLSVSALNRIDFDGTDYYVPFLDVGMYDGRQLMLSRVLNLDIDILRGNFTGATANTNSPSGESWLPNSGLIYAFREDAIREDAIARPATTAYANCDTELELLQSVVGCRMDPRVPRDPPLNDVTGVSLKPVDFVADPDRRIHGFRLANGLRLGREGTAEGLSFISDNPVYVLGDFNNHSVEEFTQPLIDANNAYTNFYTRTTLDTRFARANPNDEDAIGTDRWRPTEILSDAVTILSETYCDGTIESGLRRRANDANIDGEICNGPSTPRPSFLNSNYISRTDSDYLREDGGFSPPAAGASESPIAVDRDGTIRYVRAGIVSRHGDEGGSYISVTNQSRFSAFQFLNRPADTRIDSVIVSGILPTRVGESNGGLHNFPRFLEDWGTGTDIPARLRGSLIQLNFSTYATANRDQADTFDFNNSLAGSENGDFAFYTPPARLWGYDPALQYVPATPVVKRLLGFGNPRSEIFERIDTVDPYIQQLCQAIDPVPEACS